MLQFDANANAHANIDACVNGPLKCEGIALRQTERLPLNGLLVKVLLH